MPRFFLSLLFLTVLTSGCRLFDLAQLLNASDTGMVSYFESFDNGTAENWEPNIPENWAVKQENGIWSYHLLQSGPHFEIRRPTSFAILTSHDMTDFELIVQAKCFTETTNVYRDLCLFFGFQDDLHYYYTHFSAISDDVHNMIGIVNGTPRERISDQDSGKSDPRLITQDWHTLKIKRDTQSGLIEAYFDDMETPILTATDNTFKHGKIGLGSFDDTGAFSQVKLIGTLYEP